MCVLSPEFTVIVSQSVTNIPAFFSCRLWIPNPLTRHHQQSSQVCQRSLEGTNNAWPLYSLASYKYMYSGSIVNLQDPRINRVKSFIYDGERGGGWWGRDEEGWRRWGGQQMAKIYIWFEGTNWPSKSKAWQIGMYVLGESLYHYPATSKLWTVLILCITKGNCVTELKGLMDGATMLQVY